MNSGQDVGETAVYTAERKTMDPVWEEMRRAAAAVRQNRKISSHIEAGGVAAAVQSASGRIYTGVCVDACCSLGICAERNAIFRMITCGESAVRRVLVLMPDGTCGVPCGACRELLVQLMPEGCGQIEILLDGQRVVTLEELTPMWWI